MFLRILDNDKHNPDALYFMTLIDQQSGRQEVAEHRATELVSRTPRDGKALNLLGTILMSQGKLEEAAQQFQLGIKHDSDNPVQYVNAAICQIGLGNPDKSIELCKHAQSLDPDYINAWNILGNAYLGKSEFGKAASALSTALEKMTDFTDARFNLGRALLEDG